MVKGFWSYKISLEHCSKNRAIAWMPISSMWSNQHSDVNFTVMINVSIVERGYTIGDEPSGDKNTLELLNETSGSAQS